MRQCEPRHLTARDAAVPGLRDNVRMRKVLIGAAAAATAGAVLVIGAVGVDYGTSIYAEYRLSTSVRKAANLGTDPFVAIVAFPFIPQAMRQHYSQLEIKANAVDHAMVGKATLEATMYSVDLTYASWLIRPDAKLPVGRLESRIIIDSVHLGRYLGITDLMVEAPPKETNTRPGRRPRLGHLRQPRPGVQRHAEIGRLRPPGQRLDGPFHRAGRPGDADVHPHRRPRRTRHRQPTRPG